VTAATPDPAAFGVEGELTVYRAAELKAALVRAARADAPLIDLAGVTEIDTAGVQLLLLARHVAAARGVPLRLAAASEPVRETMTFLGIVKELE
jgi:anti-sigma B factor antagonist